MKYYTWHQTSALIQLIELSIVIDSVNIYGGPLALYRSHIDCTICKDSEVFLYVIIGAEGKDADTVIVVYHPILVGKYQELIVFVAVISNKDGEGFIVR